MRTCPKCKTQTLAPLAEDRVTDPDTVPPSRCTRCRGVWLPHGAVEQHVVPPSLDAEPAATSADELPGFCPGCRGLLVRARVQAAHPFHLDRCPAVPIVVRKRTRGGNMRRIAGLALTCGALVACTSVKMVQREGCWVKQTERTFGGSSEELGFCTKARPQWAEDRLSRLVQECMAQADYRWENRALAAWTRGEPIPPQDSDDQVARTCMGQAASALGLEVQNDVLKSRLADVD